MVKEMTSSYEEKIIKAAHAYETKVKFRENYKPTFKEGV